MSTIYAEKLRMHLEVSIAAKQKLLSDAMQFENFSRSVEAIVQAYKRGGRLYIAGNGGSAADAQHLAAEFVSKLARPRDPLPAEALTVDTSILTAIGNDYGYELVFARQIAGKMQKNDIFLAITTSGESENIIKALQECRKLGLTSVLLAGKKGGRAIQYADHAIVVPGTDTSTIQEQHMVLYHTLCGCVEDAMFPV